MRSTEGNLRMEIIQNAYKLKIMVQWRLRNLNLNRIINVSVLCKLENTIQVSGV